MNGIPPAFRGRPAHGPSFTGMEDEDVLRVAANALRMVQMLPIGSKTRASQWSAFDSAMGELTSRAVVHALEKIHEIHERELPPGGDGGL